MGQPGSSREARAESYPYYEYGGHDANADAYLRHGEYKSGPYALPNPNV